MELYGGNSVDYKHELIVAAVVTLSEVGWVNLSFVKNAKTNFPLHSLFAKANMHVRWRNWVQSVKLHRK